MRTLIMDTATQSLSIALLEDKRLVAETTTNTRIQHSTQLMPLIESLCQTVKWTSDSLDEIVVTKGPGSYTGLRIGVTVAKMLAHTKGLPLYAVSTLAALAAHASIPDDAIVLPFINARRQTVFAAAYHVVKGEFKPLLSVKHQGFTEWIEAIKTIKAFDVNAESVVMISPDIAVFEEAIADQLGAEFYAQHTKNAVIRASDMVRVPWEAVDVDTFIPDYAKLAEAEENWRSQNPDKSKEDENYVERTL